ncbi:MAG TPA: DNA repair protein RecO [Candidatus Saccharimonadales bacterium]
MKQIVTQGIILGRTDYGEADRILTLLTPDHGKLRLLARGVRRVKSKLAGGIELFSVSDITFIRGRGDIGTLVSSRLLKHYGTIVQDLDRTMLGYDLIKQLNKITEDEPEPEYFELLKQAFEALDDPGISMQLVRFWFSAQVIRLSGLTPNLQTDAAGQKLDPDQSYNFNFEHMCFTAAPDRGHFTASHIKFLRLGFTARTARVLAQVQGGGQLGADLLPLIERLRQLSA